jgi:hypothetical protein
MDILILMVCIVPLWFGWNAGHHLLQGDNVVPRLLAVLVPWTLMSGTVSLLGGSFAVYPLWLAVVCGLAALAMVFAWWHRGGNGMVCLLLGAGMVFDIVPRALLLTNLALGGGAGGTGWWGQVLLVAGRLAPAGPVFFLAGMAGLWFHLRDEVDELARREEESQFPEDGGASPEDGAGEGAGDEAGGEGGTLSSKDVV